MYAVIKTGGKQYAVEQGDRLFIEKLDVEAGAKIEFDKVLYLNTDDSVRVGTPYLDAVRVLASAVENGKAKKVITFKYKAKKDYRKKRGHRQPYTLVEIDAITVDGAVIGGKPAQDDAAFVEEEQASSAEETTAAEISEAAESAGGAEDSAGAVTVTAAEEAETDKAEAPAEKPKRTARPKAEKSEAEAAEKPKRAAKPKADADAAEAQTEKPKRTARPKAAKPKTEENADTATAAAEEEKQNTE
jgi:large subunit ribosomal protein L21